MEQTALSPANMWVGVSNSDMVGAKFDLKAEVYKNGTTLAGSGELDEVYGGSSGFNNAVKSSISLTTVSGVRFLPSDTLSIKILIRSNSSHNHQNVGARLYYDGISTKACSNLDATIGSNVTYYLRDGSAPYALSTTIGTSSPGSSILVTTSTSSFKEFGTWTLP